MKPRHIALSLALAIAAGLAAFGDKTPSDEVAEAIERPAAASPAPAAASRGPAPGARDIAILRLQPRDQLIGDGGKADENDLFARQDWTPPPPPPPEPGPPPPAVAPRLPYTFIGKSLEEGKWEVYLASGERTHIAVEGGVIDGAWRVERIAPPLLTLTYLPLNQVQQLNIGAFD